MSPVGGRFAGDSNLMIGQGLIPPIPDLVINEFMASPGKAKDEVDIPGRRMLGQPGQMIEHDWIEIYNAEDRTINIGGMYLTDDLNEPMKWQIPGNVPWETAIGPKGYLVLLASGDPGLGSLHANFRLSKSGETVGLFQTDGHTLIDSIQYDQQATAVSLGRYPNGGPDWHFYEDPTPGLENTGEGHQGLVVGPQFSVRRGFYEEAFEVILTCATPGASIHYTLDGSDPVEAPTPYNPVEVYAGPITIDSTTCLRAAGYKANYLPSEIITHTYVFVDDVIGQPVMSTQITQDPVWGPQMRDALLEIPSISLVAPSTIPDDPIKNPREVPVSIEMIFPDGSEGFGVNAGIERFGGQYTLYAKQALRVSFKSMYGPSRLAFDLFGESAYGGEDATNSFNQIILRNGSHDALWYDGYPHSRGVYTRNRWCFDRQIEMGHLSMRGRFVHVYLNGVYWGQYHLMERPTADFMATYLGGNEEDYDIMKGRSGVLNMEGDDVAWKYLVSHTYDYDVVQAYLDIDNYIDYMLLNFYGGNDHDWYPNHNWVAGRRREPGGKFMFFMWDNDFLMRVVSNNAVNNGGPGSMLNQLKRHEEFKIRMADRAQKHFFNDGMMTVARVQADFSELTDRIARTIIPECARWSAEGSGGSYTPDSMHQYVDWIKHEYATAKIDVVIEQMRAQGVFPNIDAPTFSQHGGDIAATETLSITAPSGTIWYSLDGVDPRLAGGAVNTAHALQYTGPIHLTESTCLKARALNGSTWSALNEAIFSVGPVTETLRITEIMYNPVDPNAEFIELQNIGTAPINLGRVKFTNGIDFTFPSYDLAPGDYVLVALDPMTLAAVAPSIPAEVGILGPYVGQLSNGGEKIELVDAIGRTIHEFSYKDGWHDITDGLGFSLTIKDPTNTDLETWGKKSAWRPSGSIGGSPGQ